MRMRSQVWQLGFGIALFVGACTFGLVGCSDDSGSQLDSAVHDTGAGDRGAADGGLPDQVLSDSSPGDTTPAPPTVTLVTDRYWTAQQMLLANEINESGEPFAEALGYDLDLLDPMVADKPDKKSYVLGIENYEYSRYQLGTVISRSGIGLHMMWAPMIAKAAAAEPSTFDGSLTGQANGFNEDDELMKNIGMFAKLSNHSAPGHPWPQFAEFVSGDPRLPNKVDAANFAWKDFSTLRWDRSKMDKTLVPAALGQTLMKQYLWAQDMLGAFHDDKDAGIDADGTKSPDKAGSNLFDPTNNIFYGGNALDGFIGMVLTAESINKVAFIIDKLTYDGTALGAVDPATYDPKNGLRYLPHAIAVTEGIVAAGLPPRATELKVTDPKSQLFDQVSVLWGTTSFADMMDPATPTDAQHFAYASVFDGSPFPAAMSKTGTPGPYDLMKGASKVIFMNLQAMHYDATNKVYVDQATLTAGKVVQQPVVRTQSSAYLIVALESFVKAFKGTPLEAAAKLAIKEQATFISTKLSDAAGSFIDEVDLVAPQTATHSVASQAAAVRALYVAARVLKDTAFATQAKAGYDELLASYHVPALHAFRSAPGVKTTSYTPHDFAIIAGALREAALEGKQAAAADIYVDFFRTIGNAMQLSEGAATGETGNDSDGDKVPFIPEQAQGLPPVFATKATLTLP